MTAKQYLGQVERLNKMISNKIIEVQQLETQVCNISILNDGDRVQTSGSKDRLGDSVAKLVDLRNELSEMINSYITKRCEIIKTIESVPQTNYYEVLFKKYVEGKSLEQICCEMNYSMQHIKRIHGFALNKIKEIKKLD